jgi:hypothetical protein
MYDLSGLKDHRPNPDEGRPHIGNESESRLRNANRAWKRLEFDSVDQVLASAFGEATRAWHGQCGARFVCPADVSVAPDQHAIEDVAVMTEG